MDVAREVVRAEERIWPFVRETPCERSAHLSKISGGDAYLKLEHLQHTGSFKFRGATNKVRQLDDKQIQDGVIAASTGNHGMAVSRAAQQRGTRAKIYMAEGASEAKVEMIRSLGGETVFFGENPVDAEVEARRAAKQEGKVFISPYNDLQVIAGQGTIGVELQRQVPQLDAVFVAVGGGGLISGIAGYLKSQNPRIKIIACWPENSRVMYESMKAGHAVEFPEQPTISDSTAGGVEEGAITIDLCRRLIDDSVLVSEREILHAMRLVFEKERWLVEGAAGVPVAAYLKQKDSWKGKTAAMILCGRNIPPEKAERMFEGGAAIH